MDLSISGLASGFDWKSLVSQLVDVERAPERALSTQKDKINQQINAYTSVKTQLSTLRTAIKALKDASLFQSRTASSSDVLRATGTATTGAILGAYEFNITQMATTAVLRGGTDQGKKLSDTADVSSVVVMNAGFATSVTAGTFTVNGKAITIDSSTTLQGVFDQISTATGGTVTGSYDSTNDKIVLTGSSTVVLGSATDTSNFLGVARLSGNGTNQVTSSSSLGAVKRYGPMNQSNLTTPVTDGGTGAGLLKVNGVEISYNASTDSISDVLNRITNSTAGVVASYDPVNDRFSLTNKATGNVGISVEDTTGNFAAATGLATGTLTNGKDLLYTVNGGGELSSHTNTITDASSGVTGLSVTALSEGQFTITVGSDTDKIKTAIQDFVTKYNQFQSQVGTYTASSTDAKGKVTAGVLAGDQDASQLSSRLRSLMTSDISGLTASFSRLDSLGFASNGNDDSLSTSDTSKLDDLLANHLDDLEKLFTSTTNGLASKLDDFMEKTIGDNGTLVSHQNSLTATTKQIDTQISDQERQVLAYQATLTAQFVAMESAQAKINQQLAFLTKQFG
jgi:flagellar hook-associated protein 2